MSTSDGTDLSKAVLPTEIWNPDTETWTTVASLTNGREYHSTALLLPDGRVLMAGGGAFPGRATDILNAEIYSPPYLFKGARPTIASSPVGAGYGTSFDVQTPDAAQIAKVSLVRTSSVTHSFNENQRFQFLSFTAGSGKVTVQAPAANLAPPGDYLLFLLNENGVPSVGSFIRLSTTGDATPPTAPSNLSATASAGQVALAWTGSTDAGGVSSYSIYRSTAPGFTPSPANRIAQTPGTSYVDTNVPAGTYYYQVTADDFAGNTSGPSNEVTAVVASGPPGGLVAAYGFDEGSGTTTADRSAYGNTARSRTQPGRGTAGKFGNALSFNGTNARVDVNDSNSLDVTSGMTLEAWVKPSVSNSSFRTAILKEQPGQLVYALYTSTNTGQPDGEAAIGSSNRSVSGSTALTAGAWSHVAATYEGSTLRLYVNGTQVSQLAVSGSIATSNGALRIGGNSIWGEYFSGLIDEVRIYNRALTAGEIGQDMVTPINSSDTSPPTAPGALSASGAVGKATLSWGAATDNVGVVKYDLYRSSVSGFTPALGNRIAQPTGTSYTDTTAPGSYYYKVAAEDGAGNIGPASNEASATVLADTTAPTAPSDLAASVAGGTVNLSWTGSTDDVAVTRYDLYRGTSAGFTPTVGNRIAQPLGTSYSDSGLAIGSYYYKVAAEDAAGNLSGSSNEVTASVADSSPPTAPSGVATAVVGTSVNISWSASSDNVGVARYNLYRGTSPGFTPSLANRIAQPLTTLYSDLGLTAGSYYYKLSAEDAAGNVSGLSNEAQAVIPDTSPPTTPSLSANGGAGQASLSWTAATDNVAVTRYDLYRSTTSGFTPSVANRIAQPSGLSYSDLGLAAGTYYYKLQAEDGAGNLSAVSNEASALVTSAAPSGLVAAYGFDEGTGTTTADRSGNGNTGTVSNTTWAGASAGKFGNALSFNGTNAWVTVNSSSSLNLTTGMTAEAWVNPTALGNAWRTVLLKEQTGNLVYDLYANGSGGTKVPSTEVYVGGAKIVSAAASLATGTWTHLAATFDGSTLRLYVNGTQVSQLAVSGSIATSNGALRIGGNSIWGEYFSGLIDEVRIYNRALTAGEIGQDMVTPINSSDTSPPTAPGALSASGAVGKATLSWGAATDNVGVVKYDLYRSSVSGFTPALGNRIAQPTGTSYTDTTAPGSYYYKVAAEDGAGNIGPASNEASATVLADTTAPTAPSEPELPRLQAGRSTSPGLARQTTSRLPGTTSTGGQAQALPRRSATGSPSLSGRAIATAGLRSGATTTRWPPRMLPAISPAPRTRSPQALPTRVPRLPPPGWQPRLSGQASTSPGALRATTWASRATTSTGARARALRLRLPTGSHSR